MKERIEELRERLTGADEGERQAARDAMRAVAKPRLTGSEGASEVDAELRGRLEGMGYEVRELAFSFSALPGRWGMTILGSIALIGLALAALFVAIGWPIVALGVLAGLLVLDGLLLLLAPWLIRKLPWGRVEAANLLATRPNASPRFLVVAHRDSKSQMVPILLRSAAGVAIALVWLALVGLAVLGLTTDIALGTIATVVGVVGGLAALPLVLSWVGNDSPGALDNASGVVTLLGVAKRSTDDDEVGFLLTDAEELGLAGARAAARQIPPVEGIINVDGIDDRGTFRIMERHGFPRRGSAPHLATSLFTAAGVLDLPVERNDLPLGIQVDHIPFFDAKLPALTLMRGERSALMRVHLKGDHAERTTGAGAADAAALVAAALRVRRTPFGSADGTLPEGLRAR